MLIARGAKEEYGIFANSDDGMLDFGSGKLLKKHKSHPYEIWELKVEDLVFSIDMEHLLLPGTKTSVTTLQVVSSLVNVFHCFVVFYAYAVK